MRQRWKAWVARAFWMALLGAPLWLFGASWAWIALKAPFVWGVKKPYSVWPLHHLHAYSLGMLAGLGWGVTGLITIALGILAISSAVTVLIWSWKVAWRQKHRPLFLSWADYSLRDEMPYVTYEKPAPLLRGRLGSR